MDELVECGEEGEGGDTDVARLDWDDLVDFPDEHENLLAQCYRESNFCEIIFVSQKKHMAYGILDMNVLTERWSHRL